MTTQDVARLKITLQGIDPPVWRRLEMPLAISFAQLSDVIQAAFGWTNSHLDEFEVGARRIGVPVADDWARPRACLEDEASIMLGAALAGGARRLLYRYDFGDDWEHLLEVEKVYAAVASLRYPRCTGGRRAAPPEDCGGAPGYRQLLAVLADPSHEEYVELRAWAGGFDAETFDVAAADEAVRILTAPR